MVSAAEYTPFKIPAFGPAFTNRLPGWPANVPRLLRY
jgi:hypothetical protein